MIHRREPQPILLPGVLPQQQELCALARTVIVRPVLAPSAFCKGCASVVDRQDRFCGWCGARLRNC